MSLVDQTASKFPQLRLKSIPRMGSSAHAAGFIIVAVIVLCAILADVISPHNPALADPFRKFLPLFSPGHLLGTDELGRDLLSRLIHGGRFALFVAVVPTLIALVIGGFIGLFSGYVGGFLDSVIMRTFDVMFSFPGILLALGISAALGAGMQSMLIAMVIVTVPEFGRVVRGSVLSVKEEPYIEAALTLGVGHWRIATRHVAPNILSPITVLAAMQTGNNVILAAALSFLGLGAQPPTADWGSMLSGGRGAMTSAPHVATLSGLAIVILAIGFNLIGDAVRDRLDPNMQKGS